MAADDFSGNWQFCYWFPSNNHDGEDPSEYRMRAHQKGDELVMESLPNDIDAYMLVRLKVDGDLATGTWHETTSPTGEFKGMDYSGAGQLLVSKDRKHMEGMWAGAGFDHDASEAMIYSGRWELKKLGS
jgi:hypothetical protein